MGLKVVRYERDGDAHWGVVVDERIKPLQSRYATLQELLTRGVPDIRETATSKRDDGPVGGHRLLSPVTRPANIVAQGANYATHRVEAGMTPNRPSFNCIFAKSDRSLCGPQDDVVKPPHVRFLDYEVELGLVIGKPLETPVSVTEAHLGEYVAGIVIANDISARDVQLSQGQWFKGKSYRTFCPTGPYLYLFEPGESAIVHDLELKLWVNGELRQFAHTSQMLYKPEETLTELSGVFDLYPGDLILTGTPGGVALNLTPDEMAYMNDPRVSGEEKIAFFARAQGTRTQFLQDGDVMVCQIRSTDGSVDLGMQRNRVIPAER
ncbi:MAG: fumarylacetoacetate hydrolase family protein [Alicyclobacillaceae bacterium]|nr:fumarylacetoacetate hydrolase family protein [Alicyclobacillaceae bacterium]